MKNLFEAARVEEVKERVAQLRPDSKRRWGTMNPAQVLDHCSRGFEMAAGQIRPPRAMIGRILGPIIKPLALKNDDPMRKNSPTAKELLVQEERDFDAERERLRGLVDRFAATGPTGCTTHPHMFFGRLTPEEWAILMYKHMDHHLRQFGV
jgi:Protein of unknown function (DUF1569)